MVSTGLPQCSGNHRKDFPDKRRMHGKPRGHVLVSLQKVSGLHPRPDPCSVSGIREERRS